jgi:TRAP-type C4-dicarboxylate transport system permease small subunit
VIRGYVNFVTKASKLLENIAAIILFLTAMLVVANVLSRRILNLPIQGTHDLILFLTPVLISLSIAYCAVKDGHISISIFIDKLPMKLQIAIDTLIGIITAVILFFITRNMFLYADEMRKNGEVSLTIGLPHHPFVFILAIGFGMLGLVFVGKVLTLYTKAGDQ